MASERWGAFSVIDHQDAAKMACDVLLYDRLVFPVPREGMAEKWAGRNWDPSGRVEQLGDRAIEAEWTLDHHLASQEILKAIAEDAQGEIEAENRWEATRRVLIMGKKNYTLPDGVDSIQVLSAYQSEKDSKGHTVSPETEHPNAYDDAAAQLNSLISARILVPNEDDPEESLTRALDIADNVKFQSARQDFFEWRDDILASNLSPDLAADRLEKAVQGYNEHVRKTGRAVTVETIVLATAVGTTLATAIASVSPGLFAPLSTSAVAGAGFVTLGSATAGAVAQVAGYFFGKAPPPDTKIEKAAGMFHQVETKTDWVKRGSATPA